MQHPEKWDDLRVFLALMRGGTFARAAKRLGINASTVGRRLDSLEDSLGLALFERTPDGTRPTPSAEQLMPLAEAAEESIAAVGRLIEGRETEPEGLVRITAPPGVCDFYLAPHLHRLVERHPRLRIELDSSIEYASLTRREADIALRIQRPTTGDLVATSLGQSRTIAFASAAYAEETGLVRDPAELRWIAHAPALAHLPESRWLSRAVPNEAIILRTSSFTAQIRAAEAGTGAVLLPETYIGRCQLVPLRLTRALRQSLAALPPRELWLVGHAALRNVPRVAAVWEYIQQIAKKPRVRR